MGRGDILCMKMEVEMETIISLDQFSVQNEKLRSNFISKEAHGHYSTLNSLDMCKSQLRGFLHLIHHVWMGIELKIMSR